MGGDDALDLQGSVDVRVLGTLVELLLHEAQGVDQHRPEVLADLLLVYVRGETTVLVESSDPELGEDVLDAQREDVDGRTDPPVLLVEAVVQRVAFLLRILRDVVVLGQGADELGLVVE